MSRFKGNTSTSRDITRRCSPPRYDSLVEELPAEMLDAVLEQYLNALDVYQLAREQLSSRLKNAHFSLAQAKLALGPSRLGQKSWDLGEQVSRVRVHAPASYDSSQRDDEGGAAWSLEPTPRPPPLEGKEDGLSATSSESKVRHRGAAASSPLAPNRSTPAETMPAAKQAAVEEPVARSPLRPPILQFSAQPPPALRTAESQFQAVLKGMIALVEAQSQVQQLEIRVEEAKRKLRER